MKHYEKWYPARELREVWEKDSLKKVQVFSCGTSYWWCPEAGYSGCMGTSFFTDFNKAKKARIKDLEDQITDLQVKLSKARSTYNRAE